MPRRFVLWGKDSCRLALEKEGTLLLADAFAALSQGRTELNEFSKQTLLAVRRRLAETRLGAEVVLRVVDGIPTLFLADTTPLEEFELSIRLSNCFRAASIETLDDLLTWSPDRLMKLPNFGRKCMEETARLLEALGCGKLGEAESPSSFECRPPNDNEGAPLACLLDVRSLVQAEGTLVRFRAMYWNIVADCAMHSVRDLARITGMNADETTALEQAFDGLRLRLPSALPYWFVQHADSLQAAFHGELEKLSAGLMVGQDAPAERLGVPAKSLQEEILRLIPLRYDERQRTIVVSLLGLDGKEAATLDEVAASQVPPLTRERVRQVAQPVTDALQEEGRKWPQLMRAVEALRAVGPCLVESAHQSLVEQHILKSPMSLAALLRLARRAGLELDLEVKGRWLLTPGTTELIESLTQVVGKLSARWGAAYWPNVLTSLNHESSSKAKELIEGVVWLDEAKQYAVVQTRENSLANRLGRILKVTPRLKLTDAYAGAKRDSRMMNTPLPPECFRAFCQIWPWCSVEGDELVAGKGIPLSEASSDDLLVLILREMARPMRRRELMQEALKQGLKPDAVTAALSYSNVITSADGFFAVVGDESLKDFAEGRLQPEPEPLMTATAQDDFSLVPDERDPRFAPLLMAAVELRVTALALHAPWSVSELGFATRDRDSLLAWGRTAVWKRSENIGFYELATKEKVSKSVALGLAFVLFAAEAVRRSEDTGSVWPAIEANLGDAQSKLLLARSGVPKLMLRDAVETACRTFGIRHSFEDVGEVWVRTLCLQCGLQSGHIRRLGKLLSSHESSKPTAITLLLDEAGLNGSASFRQAWQLLQDARSGRLSGTEALAAFASNPWLGSFSSENLLLQCQTSEEVNTVEDVREDLSYRYFGPPDLGWIGMEPILEYRLNSWAPGWRTSNELTFITEDPFHKERLIITDGRWSLNEGTVRIRITQRERAAFRFRLMQGKDAVTDGWLEAGLPPEHPFMFFRASGAMVIAPDDVPLSEEIVLLHAANSRLAGLAVGTRFQMVLRNTFRLTHLQAGEVAQVSLLGIAGETIWRRPQVQAASVTHTRPLLTVRGGQWGLHVSVTLPHLPFIAESLRLDSGEVLPISNDAGRFTLRMSPGLAVAEVGYLRGMVGTEPRSMPVELRHGGGSFGVALETDSGWQTLDGSQPLDAAVLRTQRLRAQTLGPEQDICWVEGSRTLCGLQRWGTAITELHGLGEKLKVVRGTYNGSQVQVYAASAVTDGGFLRNVQSQAAEGWSAALPFEDALGPEHALWVWTKGRPLPYQLPREYIEKTGFALRWVCPNLDRAFGWAFAVGGARLGSMLTEDGMRALTEQLTDVSWFEAATWLRWWHVPVHHPAMRGAIAVKTRERPIETIKAWMLLAGTGLIFDELRDDAWAAATRRFLWHWRPDPMQAAELVTSVGIWSGNIEQDAVQTPSVESIEVLARVSPWLLASAAERALPVLFPYPKQQLAVLLKLMLKSLNPNTVTPGFRLNDLYERYARGESRLDGNFIAKTLVSAARAMLYGQKITDADEHNLCIALHQPGLRQLITIAMVHDVVEQWERGQP